MDKFTSYLRRPIVGYIVLVIGILLASILYTNRANENLRQGLASSCHRVNILRAQSNLSDTVSWTILSTSGIRERQLAISDIPETRATHGQSARNLLTQASKLTVTGITNCNKAIDHPKTYKIPLASPIGNPGKGTISPEVQKIIDESEQLLADEKNRTQ